MKLARVNISNFRCFEKLEVDFHPELTVIVGANAAGKTNFLEAVIRPLSGIINSYAYTHFPNSVRTIPDGFIPSQDVNPLQFPITKQYDFFIPEGSTIEKVEPNITIYIHDYLEDLTSNTFELINGKKSINLQYEMQYFPNHQIQFNIDKTFGRIQQFMFEWQKNSGISVVPIIAYYRSPRLLPFNILLGNVMDIKFDQFHAFNGALDASTNFLTMLQWFYQRENQELRESKQIKKDANFQLPELKAVRDALRIVIENIDTLFFDGSPPLLKVKIKNPNGTPEILALEQLSQGYRSLLSTVMDFARRLALGNPKMENPLEAKGILLIDEVELHLHPVWQQRVLLDLRKAFPNTQIIVTTHSPAVVTTVKRENIILLDEKHQVEYLPEDFGTYGAETSKVLAQVFGVDARPKGVETTQELDDYLLLVENGNHNTEKALELRKKLETNLGKRDPILLRADLRIKMMGRS